MAREETHELGGLKTPAVMEGVYTEVRSEEVVPEMRGAAAKARAGLEVGRFIRDLDRNVCAEASEALGADPGSEARVWRRRFRTVRGLLVPAAVLPIREDFWCLMGRRARALKLATHQIREVLSWGSSFRAALESYRSAEPHKVAQSREREAAASSRPSKVARRD